MQPPTTNHDDLFLVTAALRIAGGYRALERTTEVTRQVCWRLQKGKQKRLCGDTRRKLRDFVNGE